MAHVLIERKAIPHSSSIASVGYDAASQRLHVEFTSGKTYEYSGVTPEEHEQLVGAPSVGQHFSKHLRPNYEGRLLS